jgi:hypothetical protein
MEAPEKSGAFLRLLSAGVHSSMVESSCFGGFFDGIPPKPLFGYHQNKQNPSIYPLCRSPPALLKSKTTLNNEYKHPFIDKFDFDKRGFVGRPDTPLICLVWALNVQNQSGGFFMADRFIVTVSGTGPSTPKLDAAGLQAKTYTKKEGTPHA